MTYWVRRNMYACMQNLEVAVLCMCRCVPVLAIINLLALFWVLFDQIICIWANCHILCNHFVKYMGILSYHVDKTPKHVQFNYPSQYQ